ncbi:hypothetical protein [Dubosiella newyorkensis]|uniref:hypothetical protein n=1 Tax=Dubosiella newyorkensis TaxID=1862672 RepID=UPI002729F8E3|nr:hypothetical protein [Dubosiella newyorkensis]
MKKIKQQEIMQRYIASRSGMYTWSVPTYSNTAKSPIKAFAFPTILKLCGLEDE